MTVKGAGGPEPSPSAASRQRALRLELVGLEIDRQRRTLRQPFINPEIPTRGVLQILDALAELAGDYHRTIRPRGGQKES